MYTLMNGYPICPVQVIAHQGDQIHKRRLRTILFYLKTVRFEKIDAKVQHLVSWLFIGWQINSVLDLILFIKTF